MPDEFPDIPTGKLSLQLRDDAAQAASSPNEPVRQSQLVPIQEALARLVDRDAEQRAERKAAERLVWLWRAGGSLVGSLVLALAGYAANAVQTLQANQGRLERVEAVAARNTEEIDANQTEVMTRGLTLAGQVDRIDSLISRMDRTLDRLDGTVRDLDRRVTDLERDVRRR